MQLCGNLQGFPLFMVHEVWAGTTMTPCCGMFFCESPELGMPVESENLRRDCPKNMLEHWNAGKGDMPKVHVEIFIFPTRWAQKPSYK